MKDNRSNRISGYTAADVTDTNSSAVIAAQGANVAVDITDIVLSNNDAAAASVVQILNGSTVKMRVQVTTGANTTGTPVVIRLKTPLSGAVNTAWNVKCETNSAQVQAFMSGVRVYV